MTRDTWFEMPRARNQKVWDRFEGGVPAPATRCGLVRGPGHITSATVLP